MASWCPAAPWRSLVADIAGRGRLLFTELASRSRATSRQAAMLRGPCRGAVRGTGDRARVVVLPAPRYDKTRLGPPRTRGQVSGAASSALRIAWETNPGLVRNRSHVLDQKGTTSGPIDDQIKFNNRKKTGFLNIFQEIVVSTVS